jgi:hypothetical protein
MAKKKGEAKESKMAKKKGEAKENRVNIRAREGTGFRREVEICMKASKEGARIREGVRAR